jgi:diphosphomevalonate decarboxylase
MTTLTATATAHPNIAFIKYWGNQDDPLRVPSNGSISMNLGGLTTQTRVTFDSHLPEDILDLNGVRQGGQFLKRVTTHLNLVRGIRGLAIHAHILSENNFPTGSGIASSASAFAALTLAATTALGLQMGEKDLSRIARRGSGSACRSIPGGFVEWTAGSNDRDSFAFSIASPEFWDLTDCIAIFESDHKKIGSTEGHSLAKTSPLQAARVEDAERRLEICREAIQKRDFAELAEIIELDSTMMHAVMMTSTPPLFYWSPATLQLLKTVIAWRKSGLPVAASVDAGPNVHVICETSAAASVAKRLSGIPEVKEVLLSQPGGPAVLK